MSGVLADQAPSSWTLSADAVERWMESSTPGQRLVYAKGARLVRTAGVEAVSDLHQEGEVILNLRKVRADHFEWLATRRAIPERPRGSVRGPVGAAAEVLDDEYARLMKVLRRTALANRPCPTNRELATLASLSGPDQCAYLLRKAISAKIIRVETRVRGERVVTIVATGRRTARS